MTEGITCYERDETLCEDQMCLRTGCRLRNERLSPSYPVTSGPYCARKSHVNSDWHVEREFDCINDLRCWFIIATVYEPDASEMGYTDGAIGSAEQRAKDIAKALNGTRTAAQAPMRADIAQMIDAGWKTGKSSSEVAEEILREFDASTVSSTTLRQCPICARRVASPCETLAIATSCPLSSTEGRTP